MTLGPMYVLRWYVDLLRVKEPAMIPAGLGGPDESLWNYLNSFRDNQLSNDVNVLFLQVAPCLLLPHGPRRLGSPRMLLATSTHFKHREANGFLDRQGDQTTRFVTMITSLSNTSRLH